MAVAIKRVSEFFLLRDLEERARVVPPERRLAVRRAHMIARQKRAAAELLWDSHAHTEALVVLRDAIAVARDAEEPQANLHALDAELGPDHEAEYLALHDELESVFAHNLGAELGARGVARLRANRLVLGSALVVALLVLAGAALRPTRSFTAEASVKYSASHDAKNAIDGNPQTEWLLPDRAAGYLEVRVAPPRSVNKIRIHNARNAPYNDRATKDFEVEVFLDERSVKHANDSFPALTHDQRDPRDIAVNAKIDRIRINVLSHHGTGAGIAEVELQ